MLHNRTSTFPWWTVGNTHWILSLSQELTQLLLACKKKYWTGEGTTPLLDYKNCIHYELAQYMYVYLYIDIVSIIS